MGGKGREGRGFLKKHQKTEKQLWKEEITSSEQLTQHSFVLVTESCLTLCDPMDCSPPGSSVHGILQTRILEWVAIPFSKGSSNSGIKAGSTELQANSLPSESPGTPNTK